MLAPANSTDSTATNPPLDIDRDVVAAVRDLHCRSVRQRQVASHVQVRFPRPASSQQSSPRSSPASSTHTLPSTVNTPDVSIIRFAISADADLRRPVKLHRLHRPQTRRSISTETHAPLCVICTAAVLRQRQVAGRLQVAVHSSPYPPSSPGRSCPGQPLMPICDARTIWYRLHTVDTRALSPAYSSETSSPLCVTVAARYRQQLYRAAQRRRPAHICSVFVSVRQRLPRPASSPQSPRRSSPASSTPPCRQPSTSPDDSTIRFVSPLMPMLAPANSTDSTATNPPLDIDRDVTRRCA